LELIKRHTAMPSKRKQIELEVRRLVEEHYILNGEDVPEHTEVLIGRLQHLVRETYKEIIITDYGNSRFHRS